MASHLVIEEAKVQILCSDGQRSRLPPVNERIPLADGTIDCLLLATDKQERSWRKKIATDLIHYMKLNNHQPGQRFILEALPEGYKLYCREKGDKDSPRGDHYLYGSRRVFRSPAEFVFHAKWLALGKPLKSNGKPDCECTYCSKTPQSDLSKLLIGGFHHGASTDSSSRAGRGKRKAPVEAVFHVKDYTKAGVPVGAVWKTTIPDTKDYKP